MNSGPIKITGATPPALGCSGVCSWWQNTQVSLLGGTVRFLLAHCCSNKYVVIRSNELWITDQLKHSGRPAEDTCLGVLEREEPQNGRNVAQQEGGRGHCPTLHCPTRSSGGFKERKCGMDAGEGEVKRAEEEMWAMGRGRKVVWVCTHSGRLCRAVISHITVFTAEWKSGGMLFLHLPLRRFHFK